MSARTYRARMLRANQLAEERATAWRVWLAPSRMSRAPWRIVTAGSAEKAMRKVGKRALSARPSLSSAAWRAIYAEVGQHIPPKEEPCHRSPDRSRRRT